MERTDLMPRAVAAMVAFVAAAEAFNRVLAEAPGATEANASPEKAPGLWLAVQPELRGDLYDQVQSGATLHTVCAPMTARLFLFAHKHGYGAEVLWRQSCEWQGVAPDDWEKVEPERRAAFVAFAAFVRGIGPDLEPETAPEPKPSGAGRAGREPRRNAMKPRRGLAKRVGDDRLGQKSKVHAADKAKRPAADKKQTRPKK